MIILEKADLTRFYKHQMVRLQMFINILLCFLWNVSLPVSVHPVQNFIVKGSLSEIVLTNVFDVDCFHIKKNSV